MSQNVNKVRELDFPDLMGTVNRVSSDSRCRFTGHLPGTVTRGSGKPCPCENCRKLNPSVFSGTGGTVTEKVEKLTK